MKFRSYVTLLFFILLVSGVSFFAAQFRPGDWYVHLVKPSWTPSNWIFPVVWTALYLMIALVGWLIFLGSSRTMKLLWVMQLIFNGLWSWLFFGMNFVGFALADSAAMFFCILLLLWRAHSTARVVFWLMVPYLLWTGYALALNAAIYRLNTI